MTTKINKRLITEEYMNQESTSNQTITTQTLIYRLPVRKRILIDKSIRKLIRWQCSNKKNKNWKNWIRKYKRKYGKLNYLKMINNTNGHYTTIRKTFCEIEHLQRDIIIRTMKKNYSRREKCLHQMIDSSLNF